MAHKSKKTLQTDIADYETEQKSVENIHMPYDNLKNPNNNTYSQKIEWIHMLTSPDNRILEYLA